MESESKKKKKKRKKKKGKKYVRKESSDERLGFNIQFALSMLPRIDWMIELL